MSFEWRFSRMSSHGFDRAARVSAAAAWAGGVLAAVVTVVGLWSVGWYFAPPALGFLVAAGLLTLNDRHANATAT